MELSTFDYCFIIVFFSIVLGIGAYGSKIVWGKLFRVFPVRLHNALWLSGLSIVASIFEHSSI